MHTIEVLIRFLQFQIDLSQGEFILRNGYIYVIKCLLVKGLKEKT